MLYGLRRRIGRDQRCPCRGAIPGACSPFRNNVEGIGHKRIDGVCDE